MTPLGHCPKCDARSVTSLIESDGTVSGTTYHFSGQCRHQYLVKSAIWKNDEEEKRSLGAVMIMINRANQVLVSQRIGGQFNQKIQFIGGTVEVGENSKRAALRETREEAGIEIPGTLPVFFLGSFDGTKAEGDYTMHVYVCQWMAPEIPAVHTEPTKMGPWYLERLDRLLDYNVMPLVPKIVAELQDWRTAR